jgi:hypothetical protein
MNRSIQFCLCAVVIICLRPALAALPFALPFALGTALVDGGTGSGQSSTLLPDGRLLVIGGQGPSGPLATAGIKDAQTASITQVSGQLQYARAWHTATLLPDGTILVLGGVGRSNVIVSQAGDLTDRRASPDNGGRRCKWRTTRAARALGFPDWAGNGVSGRVAWAACQAYSNPAPGWYGAYLGWRGR